MKTKFPIVVLCGLATAAFAGPNDGSMLPFPPTPTASVAGETVQDSKAPTRKKTQYFENNASRGLYHEGWFAGTFGPLFPWDTAGSMPKLKAWDARQDKWELYDLSKDFSQADDLAAKEPARLE